MSVYPERVRKKRKVQHDSESYATQCEPPLTTGHGALDSIDNWQGVLQQNDNEHGSGGPGTNVYNQDVSWLLIFFLCFSYL